MAESPDLKTVFDADRDALTRLYVRGYIGWSERDRIAAIIVRELRRSTTPVPGTPS